MSFENFKEEGGNRGMVIIFSAFMIQVLSFGATASIGVFNIELLEYFKDETVGVSIIGALNFGVFLAAGRRFSQNLVFLI